MRQVRLSFILPSMAGGGAERVALEVIKHLPAKDYQLTLGLLRREGPYLDSVPPHVRVVEIGGAAKLSSFPRTAANLERFWHTAKPDLILGFQTELNTSLLLWLLARPERRRRLLISEHNNVLAKLDLDPSTLRRRAKLAMLKWLYPKAAGVIAVSSGIASLLQSACGVLPEKVAVIYNPVDLDEVSLRASEALPSKFSDFEGFTIVAAGRLIAQKGFTVLLRAFAQIRRKRSCRLILLGEGPLESDIRRLIQDLGIEKDVMMPGFLDNPWAIFARADVFALSSLWEGFGNVIIEAMACGIPIVSTDCPFGPREILEDGQYGVLVPVGDPNSLSQALEHLAENVSERSRLSAKGRRRAAAFSSDRVAEQYDFFFRQHIEHVRTGAGA